MKDKLGPLHGIKVLDLTQFLSGPFCTMLMADLGADVVRIERPDRPQASGPFLNGERIYDLSIMRSKKSVTLNLKNDVERSYFLEMSKKADVIVENFKPGTMKKMGLDYDIVSEINPQVVYVSISGFGQTGPYRNRGALDMVIQGMSGLMSLTGPIDAGATRCGTSVSDILTGLYAFGATCSALYEREHTGKGKYIDVAMLDSTFSCLENAVINTCIFNQSPVRVGNSHPTSVPFGTFKTSDGEIIITCSRDHSFYDLCRAMQREDLINNPLFSKAEARRQNKTELLKEITKFTEIHTLEECEILLNEHNVPNGRINTMQMICADPQIKAREMIVEVEHPVAGRYKMAGNPIKMSGFVTRYEPSAVLGQHTDEVLKEWVGVSDDELVALHVSQGK